jgi:hypothetical protein
MRQATCAQISSVDAGPVKPVVGYHASFEGYKVNPKSHISTINLRVFARNCRFLTGFGLFLALRQAEKTVCGAGRAPSGSRDGRIQSRNEGRCELEMAHDFGGEIGLERRFDGQRCGESPLAAADEIERRMRLAVELRRKALGRPGERVAFKFAKGLLHRRLFQQLAELGVVVEQPVADGGELLLLRHVGAGGDDHFFGGNVEVEARAGGLVEAGMRPPGGDVVFVRALVVGEAGVAIDAEEDFSAGRTCSGAKSSMASVTCG